MDQPPEYAQCVLTVVDNDVDLDKLAEAADRIVENQQPPTIAAVQPTADKPPAHDTFQETPVELLQQVIH